jgi:hypothetical protein
MTDPMWNIDESQDTPLVKQLRQQIKARDDKLTAMETDFRDMQKRDRTRSVTDVLREVGAKPSLARFFPEGTEPSKESVELWLKANEDVFGPITNTANADGQTSVQQTSTTNATPQTTIDAFNRMNVADSSGVTTSPDIEAQMISQLTSMRDASNGDADKFVSFLRGDLSL